MNIYTAIICFIGIFTSCSLLIKILIKYLKQQQIVDHPGERRAHKNTTPRGGGLAIVIVFTLSFLLFDCFLYKNYQLSFKLLPGALILATVSFIDDIKPLPASIRLFTHIISSYMLCKNFIYPNSSLFNFSFLIIDCITISILLAFITNIYNFLDGIDGITPVQSIHLCITILILSHLYYNNIKETNLVITIAFILLSCCTSFLFFNWHPAKIFLGDVGSTFIGLMLGLDLILIAKSSNKLLIPVFISSLYYITDGGITILLRILNGEKLWLPHLNHFFQKAIKKGMSHQEVSIKIAICNSTLLILAICSLQMPILSLLLSIINISIILKHFS